LNFIDIFLVLLILLFGYLGWRQGFIMGIMGVVTWAGSAVLAFFFYHPVAVWLNQATGLAEIWGRPLSFILIAFFSILLLSVITQIISGLIPSRIHGKIINQTAGVLPGLFEGLVVAAVMAVLLLALPLPAVAQSEIRESTVASSFVNQVERAEVSLNEIFGEAVTHTLTRITVQPESDERISLGFTVADTKPRPDLEERMLEMVNAEREAAGLVPLDFDFELRDVARSHSADMLARGYFGHVTPEGLSPFDRLRRDEVTFLIAGENLALGRTLQIAHNGLMDSPGHRANILRPQFGRIGIGILDGGRYGLMVTQMFRN